MFLQAPNLFGTKMRAAGSDHTRDGVRPRVTVGPGVPRVDCLDGLRGLAALCIAIVFHYRHFFELGVQPTPWFFNNVLFRPVLLYGWLAVDLFFGISGFIMTLIYFEAIRDQRVSGGGFATLRLSRLWPLHALTTVLVGVLSFGFFVRYGTFPIAGSTADDPYHFLLNMLMMQSIGLQFAGSFNFVSWSLSIEIVCYAIFFVVCRNAKWFDLLGLLLFLIGIYLLFNRVNTLFLSVNTGRGLVGFFAGCLICRAIQSGYARPLAFAAWGFFAFTIISRLLPPPPGGAMAATEIGTPLTMQVIVLPAVLVMCLTTPLLRWLLATPPFAWAGRVSYSVYLVHIAIQYCLFLVFRGGDWPIPYGQFGFFLMYAGLVLLVAAMTYRFVERPAQAWLRRAWDQQGLLRSGARLKAT
jgi:peptidoglycan/LPS O-acetylase OafA/YrhL